MRKSQRGNAMVEFAIAAPLLLLIAIGLVEIGRFAYFSILVGNAAHAGAQYGAQSFTTAIDNTGMTNAAKADGQNVTGLSASANHVCACFNGTTASPSPPTAAACSTTVCPIAGYHRVLYVTVTATGSFTSLFSYPGLPHTHDVSRTAVLRAKNSQ